MPQQFAKDGSHLGKKKVFDVGMLEEHALRTIHNETYSSISHQMKTQGGFDVKHSGTTAVTIAVTRESFFVSNVGDSRCIVYRQGYSNNGSGTSIPAGKFNVLGQLDWAAESLSRDHKPNMAGESERITSMNGRIDYYKDSSGQRIGPARVYAKEEDGPGLAMSRSLGDTVAERLGVIAVPDVRVVKRQFDKDRAIVVCSDGVTEFLSNERIGEIVSPFYNANDTEGACRKLVEESTLQWLKEDSVIDDITAVVIFFQ